MQHCTLGGNYRITEITVAHLIFIGKCNTTSSMGSLMGIILESNEHDKYAAQKQTITQIYLCLIRRKWNYYVNRENAIICGKAINV